MRILLAWLFLGGFAMAETEKVAFQVREGLLVSVSVTLPEGSAVVSREITEIGDTIHAKAVDEIMKMEVADGAGGVLWRGGFSFNMSASTNSVGVSCHPTLPLVLLTFKGYKWDRRYELLFIEGTKRALTVRSYRDEEAKRDIFPRLRHQRGFPADYDYWIHPVGFTRRGVSFSCEPLEKPGTRAHPLAQMATSYGVEAVLGRRNQVVPVKFMAHPEE